MEDYNPFTDPAILEHQSGGGAPARTASTASAPYIVGNNEPSAQYVIPSQKPGTTTTSQLVASCFAPLKFVRSYSDCSTELPRLLTARVRSR